MHVLAHVERAEAACLLPPALTARHTGLFYHVWWTQCYRKKPGSLPLVPLLRELRPRSLYMMIASGRPPASAFPVAATTEAITVSSSALKLQNWFIIAGRYLSWSSLTMIFSVLVCASMNVRACVHDLWETDWLLSWLAFRSMVATWK